jgi:hypothetical protein
MAPDGILPPYGRYSQIQQLLQIAHILEEDTETGLSLYKVPNGTHPASIDKAIQYFLSPNLHHKQVKYSKLSLETQLLSFATLTEDQENPSSTPFSCNGVHNEHDY